MKSIIGPSLAIFKVNNWAKSKSIIGPRSFSHYKNRGFRRFFGGSVIIVCVCFFSSQLSGCFLKIAFFKKRVQKLGFPIFCVLSLNFQNSLFLGLLKHYKNRGFSWFLCFLLLWGKKKAKKNDNWNFWIWLFFVQKWPFRDSELFSTKRVAETPIFIVFFGGALFWPSCQKREILETHQKRKKILTDNWKALFLVFLCFFCFSSFVFFFLFIFLFWFFFVFVFLFFWRV